MFICTWQETLLKSNFAWSGRGKKSYELKKSAISPIVLRKCPVVKSYVAKESAVKIVECNNVRISVNFIFLIIKVLK